MNQLSDIAKQIEVIRNKSVNEVCQLQSKAKDLFKSVFKPINKGEIK